MVHNRLFRHRWKSFHVPEELGPVGRRMLLQTHIVVSLVKFPAEISRFAIVFTLTMRSDVSHGETNRFEGPDRGGSARETVVAFDVARARLAFHPTSALFGLRITNSGIALVRIDALPAVEHVPILGLLQAARLLRKFVEDLAILSSIGHFFSVVLLRELEI